MLIVTSFRTVRDPDIVVALWPIWILSSGAPCLEAAVLMDKLPWIPDGSTLSTIATISAADPDTFTSE